MYFNRNNLFIVTELEGDTGDEVEAMNMCEKQLEHIEITSDNSITYRASNFGLA